MVVVGMSETPRLNMDERIEALEKRVGALETPAGWPRVTVTGETVPELIHRLRETADHLERQHALEEPRRDPNDFFGMTGTRKPGRVEDCEMQDRGA